MRFLSLFMLLMSFHLHAETDDFLMRRSWVKTVKELLTQIELKDKNLMTKSERKFVELFATAWADSRYNCFYGGWPSVKSGNLCQSPVEKNSSYDKSACKESELQCQPLLFGKKLCAPFNTESDKKKTFENCEAKFQKESGGNYDFLKNPSRKESEDLQEISRLAHEVCTTKDTPVCKKLLDKFPSGMKAIDQGFKGATAGDVMKQTKELSKLLSKKSEEPHDPECKEADHEHDDLARTIKRVTEKTGDELYDKIKEEFLSSPFCDPAKVVNDPSNRPSGMLMGKLAKDLQKIDPFGRQETNENFVARIAAKYKLSEGLVSEVLPLLNSIKGTAEEYENRRTAIAKARILIAQDLIKNYKPDESTSELIKDALLENHIFAENEEGEAVCPFVSKEAFDKAMAGRAQVMKKFGGSLSNKNQITIVDYSRPSNERRMFVIDIATGKVLHNTWVAHGGGGNSAAGEDGLGSSPQMSNQSGSNKSSDGFIIATQKASGKLFGNNVLLRGIDENNTNLAARGVVLHGWGSPMYQYTTGIEDYNSDTEKYDDPYDVIDRVSKANPARSDRKELEKAWSGLSSSASTSPYMNPTEGCLGVPMVNVKHLDRKGRDKTQLELLRDDLPGSLIFNYSGPEMKSKFF
jgi:hypothetical protein